MLSYWHTDVFQFCAEFCVFIYFTFSEVNFRSIMLPHNSLVCQAAVESLLKKLLSSFFGNNHKFKKLLFQP